MTKFIQTLHGDLVNVNSVHLIAEDTEESKKCITIFYHEHRDVISYINSGPLSIPELILEFGLLISSHPQGVFIFNPEHLLKQKLAREEASKAEKKESKKNATKTIPAGSSN